MPTDRTIDIETMIIGLKQSTQLTLPRTQHLPPPAKTSRSLGIPGYTWSRGLFARCPASLLSTAVGRCVPVVTDIWRIAVIGLRPETGPSGADKSTSARDQAALPPSGRARRETHSASLSCGTCLTCPVPLENRILGQ